MNDRERKAYTDLVSFLGKALGSNTEVVLQDISHQHVGIAAIANGHISGRKVGDSPSDFVTRMINDTEHTKSHRLNFSSVTHGGKVLRSSTYFIRDENMNLSGMLCINTDVSEYLSISERIKQLSGLENAPVNQDEEDDNIYLISSGEVIVDNINSILQEMAINVPLNRLTAKEKHAIVEKLLAKGIFNLKGAVAEVADCLQVSEPTIYRYLSKNND